MKTGERSRERTKREAVIFRVSPTAKAARRSYNYMRSPKIIRKQRRREKEYEGKKKKEEENNSVTLNDTPERSHGATERR